MGYRVKRYEIGVNLPEYMEKEIDQLIECIANDSLHTDCLESAIYASLNNCINYKILTREQAETLREYYCYGGIYESAY